MNIWIHSFSRAAGVDLPPDLEVVPVRPRAPRPEQPVQPRPSRLSRLLAGGRRALERALPHHAEGVYHGAR